MTAIPERAPRSNEQMPSINIGRFRIDRVEEFLLPGFAPDAFQLSTLQCSRNGPGLRALQCTIRFRKT
jgi:hypothetical protein